MLVERGAAETGDHLDVAFQVDGYTTTKALVAAGYTVLPYSAVRQEVGAGALSAVRIHRPALAAWTLSAAYRKDQGQARAVTALRIHRHRSRQTGDRRFLERACRNGRPKAERETQQIDIVDAHCRKAVS
ncbi:MAG: LysR substrate-binding domain-containing protein [Xanthobacteraceae bacterium]